MAGGFEGPDVRVGQAVHDAAVQADVAEGLGVVHEAHVLEAAEGHAEDQLLHFLLGIAAPGEEAGLLLRDFPGFDAVLIELGEAVRDALEAGLALGVHLVQEGQEEHRLVGIAHVHIIRHLQEEVLAVGVGDELPAEGFGVFLRALAVEVFEAAVLADGDLHVGDDFALFDIALDGLALGADRAGQLELRHHVLRLILPVEEVHGLKVRGVDGIIDEGIGLFAFPEHLVIPADTALRAQHHAARMIVRDVEEAVQGIGTVEEVGVVHEVKDHEEVLPLAGAHAAAELLHVDGLGHGGAGHEEHLGVRAVPALVQEIAGAEDRDLAGFVLLQDLLPLGRVRFARDAAGIDAGLAEEGGELVGMAHGGAEDDGRLIADILAPGVDDQAVAAGHHDGALEVQGVVAEAVDAHVAQVDVGPDADASYRHQHAELHGRPDIQAVGNALEGLEQVLAVGALGRGGEAEGEVRTEVGEDALIGVRRPVVALVDDEIAKGIRGEGVQVPLDALDGGAEDKGVQLAVILDEAADADLGPDLAELLIGLVHQLFGMGQEQHALSIGFGVRDRCDGLAGAGGLIEHGDAVSVLAHLAEVSEGVLLVLLEVIDHAALGRHVVVHQGEAGVGAEEGDELVLHAILRPLELAVGPAEDLPALMDHAVLLQQVVGVLVLGDLGGVVPGGAVHLDGDPAVCTGEGIVDGAVFAVDVREGILQIDILPLLGAEDIAEELDELFLGAAVAGAGCFFHGHDGTPCWS